MEEGEGKTGTSEAEDVSALCRGRRLNERYMKNEFVDVICQILMEKRAKWQRRGERRMAGEIEGNTTLERGHSLNKILFK